MSLLHEKGSTYVLHGKILHSVAGDVVEVDHLPVGPPGADPCDKGSFLTLLVASCLLLMAKNTAFA
jgi:hypothetical protein